ncbi:MAG: hypothetical protein JWP31_1930 [Aeromicrobium sp.]|nr:hypothetical protein [Aeromicrobium sp.]
MTSDQTRGPSFEMPIERGKIMEFAKAAQSDNPAYAGPDAIIPPTFLTNYARWAPPGARADHGFERARLVQGEQEYVFHGTPPQAGVTLTASEYLESTYEKEGKRGGTMRFAVVVTEFRDESDTLVAEARATYIERSAPPKEA